MKTANELDFKALLEQVAAHKAVQAFTEEYVAKAPLETRKIQGLGIAIAHWAGWDCQTVIEVCMAALEDANCHAEYEALEKLQAN